MDKKDEKDLLMKKKKRREEKSKLARKNALKVIKYYKQNSLQICYVQIFFINIHDFINLGLVL